MIPFYMKAASENDVLELVLDTQGKTLVGYFIESSDDATHTIEVSYDGVDYNLLDTIVFNAGGEQSIIGSELMPWRFVKLSTETEANHFYELIAK